MLDLFQPSKITWGPVLAAVLNKIIQYVTTPREDYILHVIVLVHFTVMLQGRQYLGFKF